MKYFALSKSYLSHFTLIKAIICGLALLASDQVFAIPISSAGSGDWSSTTTWSPAQVPTSADGVTINHSITVDTNAASSSIKINLGGILTMSGSNTLTLNRGTLGIAMDVRIGGTFNAGAGAINVTAAGEGVVNNGTFVGGAGAINVRDLKNGSSTNSSAALTVGSGGIAITNGSFYPSAGTITLNGNLTVKRNINAGAATFSGAGKIILTDADHTITGPVNIHNLETAAFTAPRTITINGAVTATGTTKLNGVSGSLIAFTGASTPTFTAFNSYYCSAAGGVTGITCNASAPPPPPVSASINLISNEKPVIFAEEVEMK